MIKVLFLKPSIKLIFLLFFSIQIVSAENCEDIEFRINSNYTKETLMKITHDIIYARKNKSSCNNYKSLYSSTKKLLTILKSSSNIKLKTKTRIYLLLMQYTDVSTQETLTTRLNEICYDNPKIALNTLAGIRSYLQKEFRTIDFSNFLAREACQLPDKITLLKDFNINDENKKRIEVLKMNINDGNERIVNLLIDDIKNRK